MIGFPFDSHVTFDSDGTPQYDRAISSEPYRKLIKSLFSTGVLPNPSTNLQVIEGEDLTVIVQAGFCVVEGCMKLEETDRALILQAGSSMDRIDSVVMRLNDNDSVRSCDLYVVQGTPGNDPVHPELTRTSSIYEIALADVFVPANSSNVAQYRITDTRYDDTRCGIISSVSEFDTSTIFLQLQAEFERFRTVNEADFNEWFSHLQDILDADTAGHLQNEINEVNSRIDNLDFSADAVTYNNEESTVESNNVQDALTELGLRAPKMTVLYNNPSGTLNDFTLPLPIDNFDYIEVFYNTDVYTSHVLPMKSEKVPCDMRLNNSLLVEMLTFRLASDGKTMQLMDTALNISGTTARFETARQVNFSSTAGTISWSNSATKHHRVYRVLGYKY